jgi:hypothetical protein
MLWWILVIIPACLSEASKTGFTVDQHNVHITTPGSNGSVIIDGSVDIMQMMAKYEFLVSSIDMFDARLHDALAVNVQQEVGCCSRWI